MGLNATNLVLQVKGDKSIASGFDHATRTGDNTFSIFFIDGSKVDLTIPLPKDGKDAVDIVGVNDLGNGKFTLILSDGSETSAVQTIKGQKGDKGDKLTFNDLTEAEKESLKGDAGVSPTITENADNTDKIYKLDITTADTTFTTPNLKGADGQGGSSSGEENVIESIKVNGVTQTVSADKSVDIAVPEAYDDSSLIQRISDIESDYLKADDISGKVDKVEGKSLISDTEISRLASVDNYDDTALSVRVKTVEDEIPNLATKTYVGEQIAASDHLKREIVEALPSDEDTKDNIIYMLKVESATGNDKYQEYMKIDGTVQLVGDTSVDLTDYAKTADVNTELGKKVNTTDIVDSLVSDATDKPLSAAQGKELDTKISDLVTSVEEDYAKKTDLHSHTNKTVLDGVTEEKVTAWDKAQENIIESVKVNNQEITIDENKAVNIDLSGYAEHDEIIGENLIPYPYAQPERTTNGITFTFASDGSIIANGTATADADFSVSVRTNFGTDKAFMLKPGTYAITGCPEGGSDSTYRIHVQFGDKSGVKYTLKADYGDGFVFEVTEEHAKYACQIQCHVQKGRTVTDLVFKPMLVIGNVLHDYQPYNLSRNALRTDIDDVNSKVDNQFSTASGDYITVTDSVDGNIVELCIKGNSFQQTYSGKNLLVYPYTDTTNVNSGVTFTDNGGSITINGTNTTDQWLYFWLFGSSASDESKRENLYGKQLVVSGLKNDVGNIKLESYYKTTDGQEYWVKPTGDDDDYFTITYPSKSEVALMNLAIVVYPNGVVNNVTVKPMIRLATETDSTYESYVGGIPAPNPSYPQEIKSVGDDGSLVVKSCGKNLIPYPYTHGGGNYNNVTITINDDRSITLNGTNSEGSADYGFAGVSSFSAMKYMVRLKEGHTYRLSLEFFSGSLPDTSKVIINGWNDYSYVRGLAACGSDATSFTFTVPVNSGIKWGCIYLQNRQGHVFDNVRLRPMLVEVNEDGTYPTEYEPYNGSTSTIPLSEPLRAIGDVKDEITYQDGKWGVLRRIKETIIDSATKINPAGALTGTMYDIMIDFGTIAKDSYSVVNKVSDVSKHIFSNFQSKLTWNEDVCGAYISWAGGTFARMSSSICGSTLDEVNLYLKDNPITMDYVLAEPVFEPFTDQTLPYLSTYDGVTNISNDDALSAEMTVKYPTTDASGVGSRNESRIVELAKDTDDKFDDVKVLGWTVPKECPIQNYTDSDGVFHQRVGRVDLGSLEWTYDTLWKATSGVSTIKNLTVNMYHSVYVPTIANVSDMPTNSVKKADSGTLWINNGSSTEKPSGYLYFELATEKTIKVDGNEAVARIKNDLSVKKFELVAGVLWLCVSGKHCVLTLNGYNLTEPTHFDKLEEYQPYLVARNVVSKGDGVCIAAVEPNGNINASDLVVGTSLTGQLFGEISWIANI